MMIHNEGDGRTFSVYNVGSFVLARGDKRSATLTQVGDESNTGYGAAGSYIPNGQDMKARVKFEALPQTVRSIDAIHLSMQWALPKRRAQREQAELLAVPLR